MISLYIFFTTKKNEPSLN